MAEPSIQDLTNELNGLKQHPSKDFRFSPEAAAAHKAAITDLENAVQMIKMMSGALKGFGDVGEFPSAIATRDALLKDIDHIGDLAGKHLAYLAAFKDAIDVAANNVQRADTP
jgi:hypothetical protein